MRVESRDGRALEVHEEGDPDGFPVLVHHGTPMSGLQYAPHVELAREQGIRLVGYDRPGYGGSTRAAGRAVADCVADVTAIADALGFERFASWGISGGGPHVIACGALCDDRLTAIASLAAVAPYDAAGLDWYEGMGEGNHIEFGKVLEGEDALVPFLEEEARGMRAVTPEEMRERIATLLGDEDRAVLTGAFAEYFIECGEHALEPGVDGWVDDDLALVRDWGFDAAAIDCPVLIVQGGADRFVPPSHGHWLAERVPGAEVWLDEDEGHLSLNDHRVPEVHEWLLARF
jgi:pimeloyl-ACP methyl ester carboxylesterase